MSDPMTKVEIEDVLSSIRRLVSEDLNVPQGAAARPTAPTPRPMLSTAQDMRRAAWDQEAAKETPDQVEAWDESFEDTAVPEEDETALAAPDSAVEADDAAAPEQQVAADADVLPDPLVLTPSLRVAESDSSGLRASLEETIAELEAAISGAEGDWEPDGGEMPPGPLDVAELGAEPETVAEAQPLSEPEQEEGALAPADASSAPVRLVSDTGDARPKELWSQYPDTLEWSAPGELHSDEAAEVQGGAEPESAEVEEPGLDLAAEEPEASEPDLTERFWAAEAEDMRLEDGPNAEPGAEDEAATDESPEWQDAAAEDSKPRRLHLAGGLGWGAEPPVSAAGRAWAPGAPEAGDTLEAEEDDDDGLFDEPEDAVIDEAALRALVSEIIRQELQGTLGERITRSVRKLVRREIQRALASRDFE